MRLSNLQSPPGALALLVFASLACPAPAAASAPADGASGATPTQTQPNEDRPGPETLVVTAHRLPTSTPTPPVSVRNLDGRPDIGTDAFRDLPSFAISQAGSLGSLTQVRVRGAEANHLLVLLDGVEIMDPTTDAGFNFANLNLAGIHQLEFLPGAHSAIWGSDAVAGVLQLSSRPVDQVRRLEVESGSFDTRYARAQLADAQDGYYYNVSLADFTTDGTNIARTGSEDDGHDNRSWFLSAGVDRDGWGLRALVRRARTESDFDPTPFPVFLPEDGDRQNRHDEQLALLGLDIGGGARNWEEHLTLSYFEAENRTVAEGQRTASSRGERWKITSVTRWAPHPRQHLDLLLEHEEERFMQKGQAGFFGDPNQRQTMKTQSAGIEWNAEPTERWRVSASARYDANSEFADSDSLRLSTRYLLRPETTIWAAWGTGIKHPSFIERYGFTPDRFIGNPDLDPETNQHLSLGLEQALGAWTLKITGFRDRLKDEIDGFFFDPLAGGFTAVNQRGTSRRAGAELSVDRSWESGGLHVGGSYLNAEDPDGSREIRRPAWLGFTRISQRWGKADLGLDIFYVDEQDDLDFSTFPARRVTLSSYTLVNASARLQVARRVTLGLRGANLLDESYEDQLGYRSPGRAWYLSLGVDL